MSCWNATVLADPSFKYLITNMTQEIMSSYRNKGLTFISRRENGPHLSGA